MKDKAFIPMLVKVFLLMACATQHSQVETYWSQYPEVLNFNKSSMPTFRATIRGRIQMPGQEPLDGALVEVIKDSPSSSKQEMLAKVRSFDVELVKRTFSDKNGEFLITELDDGYYQIRVSREPFQTIVIVELRVEENDPESERELELTMVEF